MEQAPRGTAPLDVYLDACDAGGVDPDESFLRAHMIKAGLDDPRAYAPPAGLEEAVARCVSVLNAVTVPPGLQRATDTGAGSGEGGAG